jgi:hypothetical protein
VLLEEFTDVITRPTFWKRLNLIGKTPHELLADYIGIIELIEPVETPRLARDPWVGLGVRRGDLRDLAELAQICASR